MRNETIVGNVANTAIRATVKQTGEKGDGAELHYHDELEMLYIIEGDFLCRVYDREYIAHTGDVIFINSRVPHATERLSYVKLGMLQFKESDFIDNDIAKIIKYSTRFQSQVYYPVKVFSSAELRDTVSFILKEASEKARSYEMFVRSGVYRLLGILYRENVLSDAERIYSTREVQKILPALSYINSAFAENLTLEDVSGRLGFDHSYFCRIFKIATGATFTEYLNFVRICKAEKLLIKTKDGIKEISEAVGFSSVSYFNRIFKKYRNVSARTYRSVLCANI